MTTLYAQPYNIDATGFYFETAEDYAAKAKNNHDRYGQFVEEYEIQFIDGDEIDCNFAEALGLNQCNFARFLELTDEWEDQEKIRYIVAVDRVGYSFDLENDDIDQLDIDLYEGDSLRELARHFVEEGLFGKIPESFQFYINYDAIARDLAMDYSEISIGGMNLIYRCG
ncbi:MAG: antirestriction protein ArdA [Rhizobiaceae bacterium]|nr:antirestriction protein ArdA [Rhizobiaceae bacterium]